MNNTRKVINIPLYVNYIIIVYYAFTLFTDFEYNAILFEIGNKIKIHIMYLYNIHPKC